jgi:hypothetical protein
MLEQLGDPDAVGHVGLAAGPLFDVLGVDEQGFDPAFEEAEHRLPGDAGGLHRRVGNPLGGQPVGQVGQALGVGGEGANLLPRPPGPDVVADAGDHGVLVDVEAGAVRVQRVLRRFLRETTALRGQRV